MILAVIVNPVLIEQFSPDKHISTFSTIVKIIIFEWCLFSLGLFLYVRPRYIIKKRKQVILLMVISVFCLFLLEIIVRVYLFGPLVLLPAYGQSVHRTGRAGILQASDDCEVIYEFRPNLNQVFKMVPFSTNSQGLKDKEYTIKKPDNTYRVAVLGASYAAGSGVLNKNAFHSLLEDHYNSQQSDVQYEFINFAVPAYTLFQDLALLKHKVLAYEPDHILIAISAKSIDMPWIYKPSYSCNYPVKPKNNPYFRSWSLNYFIEIVNKVDPLTYKKDIMVDEVRLKEIFEELEHINTTKEIPMTFVILRRRDTYSQENGERIKQLTKKHGFPLIDTEKAFEGMTFEETILYRYDEHPNTYAHRLFFKVIKEELVLR